MEKEKAKRKVALERERLAKKGKIGFEIKGKYVQCDCSEFYIGLIFVFSLTNTHVLPLYLSLSLTRTNTCVHQKTRRDTYAQHIYITYMSSSVTKTFFKELKKMTCTGTVQKPSCSSSVNKISDKLVDTNFLTLHTEHGYYGKLQF